MAETDLDWTFEDIPAAGEPSPAPPDQRPPPRLSAVRHAPRWLPWATLALLAAVGLGAWLFTRIGFARLRAQVYAEVAYEDERSRLFDVEAVRDVQAQEMTHWIALRAAQAAVGLPAPLPAGNLLPVDAPPQVVAFVARDTTLFEATVARRYADSAGQVYQFDIVQRYRNLGPGLWERLPPDDPPLEALTVWAGERLSVTLLVADQPFLAQALPRIDAALVQTCLDWYCPEDLKLSLVFSAESADLPVPALSPRAAGQEAAAYPIVFDLPTLRAHYPVRYALPSPHAAGYPHDALAAEALTRSLTANLLAALASDLTQHGRGVQDYFFDALVARAEARLGLSSSNPGLAAPFEYVPFQDLWALASERPLRARHADLSLRSQALDLLDYALAGQPSTFDGQLLHRLQRSANLGEWLGGVLGSGADQIESRWWEQRLAALPAPPAPLDAEFDGLPLACGVDVLVARAGAFVTVPGVTGQRLVLPGPLTLDGRYLSLLLLGRSDAIGLGIADLENQTWRRVKADLPASLLGWTTAGHLLYLDVHPDDDPSSFQRLLRVQDYDPQTGASHPLLLESILQPWPVLQPWVESAAWSPQHDQLALAVMPGDGRPHLWLVSPTDGQIRPLAVTGTSPAYSPDGSRLAIVAGADPLADVLEPGWHLDVIDLVTEAVRTVVTPQPPRLLGQIGQVGGLAWSPDGQWLSYVVLSSGADVSVFAVPSAGAGQPVLLNIDHAPLYPLGFSADSRYLASISYGLRGSLNEVVVFDLQAPAVEGVLQPVATYPAQSVAWSSGGHTLLIAGTTGLYALDPATGAYQRLTTRTCLPF